MLDLGGVPGSHCFHIRLILFFFNFKVFKRNFTEIGPLELAKMTFLKQCNQATIFVAAFPPSLQLDSPLTVVVILSRVRPLERRR